MLDKTVCASDTEWSMITCVCIELEDAVTLCSVKEMMLNRYWGEIVKL